MAQVVWTDSALADLDRIGAYIEAFSPQAAQRMAERLIAVASTLERNADRGRPITGGRRELVIVTPYLLRYRIAGDLVVVLEIRHGAREA